MSYEFPTNCLFGVGKNLVLIKNVQIIVFRKVVFAPIGLALEGIGKSRFLPVFSVSRMTGGGGPEGDRHSRHRGGKKIFVCSNGDIFIPLHSERLHLHPLLVYSFKLLRSFELYQILLDDRTPYTQHNLSVYTAQYVGTVIFFGKNTLAIDRHVLW